MVTLRESWAWIRWKKIETHREASIGWIKYMSPITTNHNTTRSKVETALLEMTLIPAEVSQFTPTLATNKEVDETTKHDNNNKKQRINSGNVNSLKDFDFDDYAPLELPAIDISSFIVSAGNEKLRVKLIALEVKCHSEDAHTLKNILTRSSLKSELDNYDNIKFVPYGLAQVVNEQVYEQKIVKQIAFLNNLVTILVHNIDSDTMFIDIILILRKN